MSTGSSLYAMRSALITTNWVSRESEKTGTETNMRPLALLFIAATALCSSTIYTQAGAIPDSLLRVTVQQETDGKPERGLHILELRCWKGYCELTTVSLNQCAESGTGQSAFYPAVQHSSTSKGNLRVRSEGNTLVVEETGSDAFGDYTNNMRFDYQKPNQGGIVSRLIGFTGGYVKNSVILKKVLTVQYIPLPRAHQVISLDCGVLLPGVDSQRTKQ